MTARHAPERTQRVLALNERAAALQRYTRRLVNVSDQAANVVDWCHTHRGVVPEELDPLIQTLGRLIIELETT